MARHKTPDQLRGLGSRLKGSTVAHAPRMAVAVAAVQAQLARLAQVPLAGQVVQVRLPQSLTGLRRSRVEAAAAAVH